MTKTVSLKTDRIVSYLQVPDGPYITGANGKLGADSSMYLWEISY
jgi:hypothetical protein